MNKRFFKDFKLENSENGQSIVIIAGALLALLGMIGLAVDLGVVYVRDSQLRTAVDAAALAGAPELSDGGLANADQTARQFLFANGLPDDAVFSLTSEQAQSELGAFQYTITATWTVDLFFMTLFSFDTADVTKTATAAYFPVTDLYASSRVSDGALTVSNQTIFGPNICTDYGDPFSPINSPWEPGTYTYRYRIYIPPDYEDATGQDLVRVEIFDPDTVNANVSSGTILYSEMWKFTSGSTEDRRTESCAIGATARDDSCLISTCEWAGDPAFVDDGGSNHGGTNDVGGDNRVGTCYALNQAGFYDGVEEFDDINPFWYVRVDENRGRAGSPGTCANPGSYDTALNTATLYELYYFLERPDGTLERVPLASYTGQADNDNDYDNYSHDTDLKWVSPGAWNQVGDVPTDCGSPNGGNENSAGDRCTGTLATDSEPGDGNGFEVDLKLDTVGIAQEDESIGGARYLYIDVTALNGSSENGYEFYAGPPDIDSDGNRIDIPSDANSRNLFIANQRYLASKGEANPNGSPAYIRSSYGVSVFAMGVLPMNTNYELNADLPLLYIPASFAGRTVTISLFDVDSRVSENQPAAFYFDTISREDFEVSFNQLCTGDCSSVWIGPPGNTFEPFVLTVPQYDPDQCTDPNDDSQQNVCTPFYGGILTVNYTSGKNDTTVWRVSLSSLPFLER